MSGPVGNFPAALPRIAGVCHGMERLIGQPVGSLLKAQIALSQSVWPCPRGRGQGGRRVAERWAGWQQQDHPREEEAGQKGALGSRKEWGQAAHAKLGVGSVGDRDHNCCSKILQCCLMHSPPLSPQLACNGYPVHGNSPFHALFSAQAAKHGGPCPFLLERVWPLARSPNVGLLQRQGPIWTNRSKRP